MTAKEYETFHLGDHVAGNSGSVYEVMTMSDKDMTLRIITPHTKSHVTVGDLITYEHLEFHYSHHVRSFASIKNLGRPHEKP